MSVDVVLAGAVEEILDEAYGELHPSVHPHYVALGEALTRRCLAELFMLVVQGVAAREAVHMVQHAERIAAERFHAGFELAEVQASFNALEQAMWRRLASAEDPAQLVASVGVLSAVLGAGKDALARSWVSLASARHVRHLDVGALYEGTERAANAP
ncbi:MAG TPA: hypothetical protein VI248_09205 [Kineosporiaceae bacterium]